MRALISLLLITSLAGSAESDQPTDAKPAIGTNAMAEAIRTARRVLNEAEEKYEDQASRGAAIPDGPEADDRPKPITQAKAALEKARSDYRAALINARESAVPGATAALERRTAVEKKIKEMQAEADANLVTLTIQHLASLPAVTVTLSDDPTRSQMQRADRAKTYNRLVSNLQERLKSKRSPVSAVYLEGILTDPDNLALFAEFSAR